MSKDIRSYFTVLSSKTQSKLSTPPSTSKKRSKAIDSSDDDIIPVTPKPAKKQEKPQKKRKVQMLSSDSEDEKNSRSIRKSEKNKKETNGSLKPISTVEAFGSEPVKQSKVPEKPKTTEKSSSIDEKQKEKNKKTTKKKKGLDTEIGIHNDANFEKTLLDLDEDFLIDNEDLLNESINQALGSESNSVKVQENQKESPNKKPEKSGKSPMKANFDEKREILPKKADFEGKKEKPSKKANSEQAKEKESSPSDKSTDTSKKKGSTSSEEAKTPNRKRPIEHDDGDPDEERHEKKRQSAILYQKYLNRSGPAHHGSKEIPQGKPDCLKNLCFIRTGVLDSLENEEFETIVKNHGGRTVHAISKKVNYVVAGVEAGPAKIEKAKNYGIKIISEDGFLDLIRVNSGMKPTLTEENDTVEKVENKEEKHTNKPSKDSDNKQTSSKHSDVKRIDSLKKIKSNDKESEKQKLVNSKSKLDNNKSVSTGNVDSTSSTSAIKPMESLSKQPMTETNKHNLSWTEKYKPTNVKQIIGQQGDKSNMKRLMVWLQNWYKNHSGKNKPKLTRPSPWAKNDDGSYFKAALLSGPPGVGKTTTANLVAKELRFDVVEFNASDTRSKKLLHEEVSQLLSTKSLAGFFVDGSAPTNQHVLLMDEVDGMAGNEDRGGVQELISLIKNSNVPIICMCNDRNHPKVRSLVNYCLDLKFSRPRLEQIKGAMMSICFKEGIKITPDALTEVINGAGMDIRQILTHLSVWSAGEKVLSAETVSKEANIAKKDTPLGPWEVCRKVFSAEEHKTMSITDRARLFYHDYSLAPLFVQDNYLKVMPHCPKQEHLKRFALAADSISMGDMIDTKIRRTNNWSLLDVEAMCASVLPGHYLEGHVNAQIDFPSWLGKNSKKNKFRRLLSELQAHMRTSISGSKSAVNLDYLTHLRNNIVRPLAKEGVTGINQSLEIMHAYNLLREDLDGILELAQWPKQKDPMNMVDSKVKAAFTRAYNKDGAKLPYAIQAAPVKKRGTARNENEGFEEEEDIESSHEDDDDPSKDAMIKAKKATSQSSKKQTDSKESKGKGGRGAGKGNQAGSKKGKK